MDHGDTLKSTSVFNLHIHLCLHYKKECTWYVYQVTTLGTLQLTEHHYTAESNNI